MEIADLLLHVKNLCCLLQSLEFIIVQLVEIIRIWDNDNLIFLQVARNSFTTAIIALATDILCQSLFSSL